MMVVKKKMETTRIIFRNYVPDDKQLLVGDRSSDDPDAGDEGAEMDVDNVVTNDDVIKEELAKLQSNEINIVPKKANYDLKMQIQDKLDKLKRRTQRAIVEMLREKINEQRDE